MSTCSKPSERSETFCVLPFLHINIDYDGRVKPCCKIKDSRSLPSANVQGAFESPFFEELRAAFLRGEKPAVCERCWRDEDGGILSYRQKHNRRFEKETAEVSESPRLLSVDTAFGNYCNAKCLTCESVSSHLWAEEEEELNGFLSKDFQRKIRPRLEFAPEFSKELLEGLRVINLTQSEALAQKGFYAFIRQIRDWGVDCSEKTIKFSTNGSIKPHAEVVRFLKGFKTVDAQFSVDAVGERFDLLRHPLRWESVDKTVEEWLSSLSDHKDVAVRCRYTASVLNLSDFYPVLLWWAEKTASWKALNGFNVGIVSTPEYLSPFIAPESVLEKYSPIVERYAPRWRPSYGQSPEKVALLREELSRFLGGISQMRKQDFNVLMDVPVPAPAQFVDVGFTVSRS